MSGLPCIERHAWDCPNYTGKRTRRQRLLLAWYRLIHR